MALCKWCVSEMCEDQISALRQNIARIYTFEGRCENNVRDLTPQDLVGFQIFNPDDVHTSSKSSSLISGRSVRDFVTLGTILQTNH